jgi:threonine synthase
MKNAYLRTFGVTPQETYPLKANRYKSDSGKLLEVVNPIDSFSTEKREKMQHIFDVRKFSHNPLDLSGVWRYREFLPAFAPYNGIVTLQEGNTPLYDMHTCVSYTGIHNLFAKHQGLNPTGSFKDNGMTTAVTMARKIGANVVACASTGNTSASMAAYAARAGMSCFVFIPEGQIAFGKLSQALEFGAKTVEIEGDFDKAMELVQHICDERNIYLLNSINPFRIEGQKTIMIEMLHQLDWQVPDWVVVPGGNLGNSSSFGKAFEELHACNFIDKVPRIAVIQAHGANPLFTTHTHHTKELTPVQAKTRATAIKIGNPVSWEKALHAIELSNGVVEEVSESEIGAAKQYIGADGIGCEPASATTIAGCKKLREKEVINADDTVVCVLTGHLLKDPDYTVDFHKDELYLDPRRTSSVTGTTRIDTRGLSNSPVKLKAHLHTILDYIEKHS